MSRRRIPYVFAVMCCCISVFGVSIRQTCAQETQQQRIEKLIRDLKSKDTFIRTSAVESLGKMGPYADAAVDDIVALLKDKDWSVRFSAANTLRQIGASADNAVPDIISLLNHRASYVRSSAAIALGRIGPSADGAVPTLIDALKDKDRDVRIAAAYALGGMGPSVISAVDDIVALLKDKERSVRIPAVESLGRIGPSAASAVDDIVALLKDEDWSIRRGAVEALGGIGPSAASAVPNIVDLLKDNDWNVRSSAAIALGFIGLSVASAVPDIVVLLKSKDWDVRRVAADALGRIGLPAASAIPDLILALDDEESDVRSSAAIALGQMGPTASVSIPSIIELLKDKDRTVQRVAADALGLMGPSLTNAIPSIVALLGHEEDYIRTSAIDALGQISIALQKQAASIEETRLNGIIHQLETGQANLKTALTVKSTSTAHIKRVLENVRITLGILKDEQQRRNRFNPGKWVTQNRWLTGGLVILTSAWMVTGLLLWFQPLALLSIHNRAKWGVGRTFGYVLGYGWFHSHSRVLDAWVSQYVNKARENLRKRPTFGARSVYVETPIGFPDGEKRPVPNDFHDLFARKIAVLLLMGDGGSGKTTFACQMAFWAMESKDSQRLCKSHRMLPIFLEENLPEAGADGSAALLRKIQTDLETLTGESDRPSEDLIRSLLRRKRILLIVDGCSELNAATQDTTQPGDSALPLHALLVTSRVEEPLNDVPKLTLTTALLKGENITNFLGDYFKQCGKRDLFTDEAFHGGIYRFTVLVGNREITALFARLYAQHMIAFQEKAVTEHPQNIPDLMEAYVAEMCRRVENTAYTPEDIQKLARKIAWQCLRATFTSTWTRITTMTTELKEKQIAAVSVPQTLELGMNRLEGRRLRELQDALKSALASRELLAAWVRTALNENLEDIAGGTTLPALLLNLLDWAEREGRLEELIREARASFPDNPALRQFSLRLNEQNVTEPQEFLPDSIGLPPGQTDPTATLSLFVDRLRLLQRHEQDKLQIKFALDPLCEYLAARYLVLHSLGCDKVRWTTLLDAIAAQEQARQPLAGFVQALYDTCQVAYNIRKTEGKEDTALAFVLKELRQRFRSLLPFAA